MSATKKQPRLKTGICRVCGCTDKDGCAEGCEWADSNRTVCSTCFDLDTAAKLQRRRQAVAELEIEHGQVMAFIAQNVEDAAELAARIAYLAGQ